MTTREPLPGARERLIARMRRRPDMLVATGDVALLFQASQRAVRVWADAGKLGSVVRTLGNASDTGHRRFRAASVLAAMESSGDASTTPVSEYQAEQPPIVGTTLIAKLAFKANGVEALTTSEVADLAGASLRTVKYWAQLGHITLLNPGVVGRGKQSLFDRKEVEAYLAKRSGKVIDLQSRVINLTAERQQSNA